MSLILWHLPFGGLILYPFKLLATWLHESSHGLVMLLSGAGFDHMEIYRDTSGLAYAQRGVGQTSRAAIAAAGYMGTPLFGAAFLIVGQTLRGARLVLAILGGALALSAIFFIRNDFGLWAVWLGAGSCVFAAALAPTAVALYLVNFVAAQACINAMLDIRVLFRTNLVVNGEVMGASDAHNMAAVTFGTPSQWATAWLLWSFAILFGGLRLVYLRQRRVNRERAPTTEAPPRENDCDDPRRSPASESFETARIARAGTGGS